MSAKRAPHDMPADRLGFAVLTVSDTRAAGDDASGDALVLHAANAGHDVRRRGTVKDEVQEIRAWVEAALADAAVDAVVVTGGTGVSPRDVTPEALTPLFSATLPGFGETFRRLSFDAIGPPAMLSRAEAGIAQGKPVFLLPGSPNAASLAMDRLVLAVAAHLRRLARG